jgi:hypothetical protein
MTGVLFTISVTGWHIMIATLAVCGLAGVQAYMMGLFDGRSVSRKVNDIHLIQGLKYKLRSGDKLALVNVTANRYHYSGSAHNGREVKYTINGGDIQSCMKVDMLAFLKQNVVEDEIVSED